MSDSVDQEALELLRAITTSLYTVSKPLAQRHAEAQNTIAQALAAARAEGRARSAYQTKDHPWTLIFPLEDGTTLTVLVGKKGRAALLNMANQEATDDVIAAAPAREATDG